MEFTISEESIIRNMMLTKSHKDISMLLEVPEEAVHLYITRACIGSNIITYQQRLDERSKVAAEKRKLRSPNKPKKPPIEVKVDPAARQKEKALANQNRLIIERRTENNRREARQRLPDLKRDLTKLVLVRIDRTTLIYAKPGEEEITKQKFLKVYTKPIDRL